MGKSEQDDQIDALLQQAFANAEELALVAQNLMEAVAKLQAGSDALTRHDILAVRDKAKGSIKPSHNALHNASIIAGARDPNERPLPTSGTIIVGGDGPSSC